MDRCGDVGFAGYMTVEAALIMSVVFMVYLFVIENMLLQYDRCIEELEAARCVVLNTEDSDRMYDVTEVNPVSLLRLQKLLTKE